jgi:flagellin-specific chaperone FliS
MENLELKQTQDIITKLREKLNELHSEANDSIENGDSEEFSEGIGMRYVIRELYNVLNKTKITK